MTSDKDAADSVPGSKDKGGRTAAAGARDGTANAAKVAEGAKPAQPRRRVSELEAKQKAVMAKVVAASFGELVTLMMRTPRYRKMPLESLEALAAAPVALGQVAIAETQSNETGHVMPVAAVLWAFVSPEVDRRLSDVTEDTIQLGVAEWRSGDIPWVIEAVGERRAIGRTLHQLVDTVFKDQKPKMRTTGPDGRPTVGRIERVEAQDPVSGTDGKLAP